MISQDWGSFIELKEPRFLTRRAWDPRLVHQISALQLAFNHGSIDPSPEDFESEKFIESMFDSFDPLKFSSFHGL